MASCPKCSATTLDTDSYCRNCGAAQVAATPRRGYARLVVSVLLAGVLLAIVAGAATLKLTGDRTSPTPSPENAIGASPGGGGGAALPVAQLLPAYDRLDRATIDLVAISRGMPVPVKVPEVVGLSVQEARERLEAIGLALAEKARKADPTVEAGRVLAQSPEARAQAEPGSTVGVTLSLGPQVIVPDTVNQGFDQGSTALKAVGLIPRLKAKEYDSNIPAGRIRSQWPKAGESVSPGTTVDVVKSLGPRPRPQRSSRSSGSRGSVCSGDCSVCHPNR